MKFVLRSVFALMALVVVGASASAGMVITSGSGDVAIPPFHNSFHNELLNAGFDRLYTGGGDAKFSESGTVKIYYHAAESGFKDSFKVGATTLKTENDESWGTELIGQLFVNGGDTFSSLGFKFTSAPGPNTAGVKGLDASPGQAGFGIFFNESLGGVGSDYLTLFLGYDDEKVNPDDNHDDMIISLVFEAGSFQGVPEPASMALWGMGAFGLMAARRRQKALKA